jgi:hypothetical protein
VKDELMAMEEAMGPDIVETFSEPGAITEAQKFRLRTGIAINLKTGWDLTRSTERKRFTTHMGQVRPRVLIVSPLPMRNQQNHVILMVLK